MGCVSELNEYIHDAPACMRLQYVRWAGETNLDAFWWSPTVMELFKRHIDVMTSRVNTYNGAPFSAQQQAVPDMFWM